MSEDIWGSCHDCSVYLLLWLVQPGVSCRWKDYEQNSFSQDNSLFVFAVACFSFYRSELCSNDFLKEKDWLKLFRHRLYL